MKVQILTQYYSPESVGAAVWIRNLAADLVKKGHDVTLLTGFPNYPDGVIQPHYRHKLFLKETVDGIPVIRSYIYASPAKTFIKKLLNFTSFSLTSLLSGLFAPRPNVIYAILPPLQLGLTAVILRRLKRCKLVVNVQDVWPRAIVAAGLVSNKFVVRLLEAVERFVYRQADAITVISNGFRDDLLSKNVQREKIFVIPNWADPDDIKPSNEDGFRKELGIKDEDFLLVYSGGMTYNSFLEPVIESLSALKEERITFLIAGDGVKKKEIEKLAESKDLKNVSFLPFQSWDGYKRLLNAADVCLVTLAPGFGNVSVPSKTFKIMAAGKPILALSPKESDLYKLVEEARIGVSVDVEDPGQLESVLRSMSRKKKELSEMGRRARDTLLREFSRRTAIRKIDAVLRRINRV